MVLIGKSLKLYLKFINMGNQIISEIRKTDITAENKEDRKFYDNLRRIIKFPLCRNNIDKIILGQY